MAQAKYKVTTMRGESCVAAVTDNRKMVSADGNRTAVVRNQKCQVGDGRYTIVECWTLRERQADGKLRIVHIQRTEEQAREWVGGAA